MSHQTQNKKRILLISSNPVDSARLQIDKEFREISEGLKIVSNSKHYKLKTIGATRYRDLRRDLIDFQPHIVHFSGHGTVSGLKLEDNNGRTKVVSSKRLAKLVKLVAEQVECVIFNICDSQGAAKEMSEHVDYAIGMDAPITDAAATEFAIGFYDGIGRKENYDVAYQLGENAINRDDKPSESSFDTLETSSIANPILFKKPEANQPLQTEESNSTPWFYHTIDHHILREIDLYNQDNNLMFGLLIAKGTDAPQSFAIHCCIELLGGRYTYDDDIENNVHYIVLDGLDVNSCFENSLLKRAKMNIDQHFPNQQGSQSRHEIIQHWLSDQRELVVLHIRVESQQQQKKINNIIAGAQKTLKSLNLGNLKLLTLFSCAKPPPKKWGMFSSKPPQNCLLMGELSQLTKNDIEGWLDTLRAKTQQNNHPEENVIQKIGKEPLRYKDVLRHLRDIHNTQYAR